ncbi:hypothetical protein M197_gp08 [Haloarcula hispanica tailed virus 2]|uniref:Uncharacterized protein n=1 Tax=Haloarcula hispanica tailed virus 2 TaxID=1273751 RepID=R4T6D4_9CAUD|nr:hypothetical protein M197_gp08 [Haloarcula hispanica tailed virus 2]AGM11254.1 hypothetical protein HHTV2_9 [Haloarcula hispanica tailed virus 2]
MATQDEWFTCYSVLLKPGSSPTSHHSPGAARPVRALRTSRSSLVTTAHNATFRSNDASTGPRAARKSSVRNEATTENHGDIPSDIRSAGYFLGGNLY